METKPKNIHILSLSRLAPYMPIRFHTVDAIGTPKDRLVKMKLESALHEQPTMKAATIRVVDHKVTVVLKEKPLCDSDQRLLRSAVHVVVEDAMTQMGEALPESVVILWASGSDVHEQRARAKVLSYKTLYEVEPVSHRIKANLKCMQDYIAHGTEIMVRSSLTRTVSSLPWREEAAMTERVETLVKRAMDSFCLGRPDSLLVGNVDEILPPPEALLSELDLTQLIEEVTKKLGLPQSRLDLYEKVYRLVSEEVVPLDVCCMLFDTAFRNVWDDCMMTLDDFIESGPPSPS